MAEPGGSGCTSLSAPAVRVRLDQGLLEESIEHGWTCSAAAGMLLLMPQCWQLLDSFDSFHYVDSRSANEGVEITNQGATLGVPPECWPQERRIGCSKGQLQGPIPTDCSVFKCSICTALLLIPSGLPLRCTARV